MNFKIGIIGAFLSSTYLISGCSEQSIKTDIYQNEGLLNNNINSRMLDSNTNTHTFNISDARYIIEAFVTINQSMDLEYVQEYFYTIGNVNVEELDSNTTVVHVVNNELEEVIATFKNDLLISKAYKKDTFDTENINIAFIEYENSQLNKSYSSGIYINKDNNIAKDYDEWNIEEKVFEIFN